MNIGCEPEVSYLYSTKSGSKRIFKSSNVPMPFGEYDIYNQKHLYKSLARLILKHLYVQRWIFKIDDHFDGLGIAYCDIAIYLPCYNDVVKEAERFAEQWSNELVQVEQGNYFGYFEIIDFSFNSISIIFDRSNDNKKISFVYEKNCQV